jgi:CcmD family protein
VSDWGYIVIAYVAVWGALAVYALVLARRVRQAEIVARKLRDALAEERRPENDLLCEAPPET